MDHKEAARVLRDAINRLNLKRTLQFSEQKHADAGHPDVDMDALRQACEIFMSDPDPDLVNELGGPDKVRETMLALGAADGWVPPAPPPEQGPAIPQPNVAAGPSGGDGLGLLLVGALGVALGVAIGASVSSSPRRRR